MVFIIDSHTLGMTFRGEITDLVIQGRLLAALLSPTQDLVNLLQARADISSSNIFRTHYVAVFTQALYTSLPGPCY